MSAIAHGGHAIAGPVDEARVDALVAGLALATGATVLDMGCGGGEWLLRILERHDVRGVGVDRSAAALARARAEAERRVAPGRLELVQAHAADFPPDPRGYDLVLCAGSTHVYGGLAGTLVALAALVRPGGLAVVGEGFWERPPDGAALAGLEGALPDDFLDLPGTVARCTDAGFAMLSALVSDQREWDEYEFAWTGALEAHVRAHPADPDAAALQDEARSHRDGYLRGYRGTLGYVTMLLGAPIR